jgi:hypothetical protein
MADVVSGYSPPGEDRPLGGYLVLASVFQLLVLAAAVAFRRSNKELPERLGAGDLLLVSAATHKLSRLIGKDKVTSFVRAPFTEYQEPGGPGEVEEKARGTGLRKAVGELLICPYCLSLWIATAFAIGLVAAPRPTRLIAFVLTAVGVSDSLQFAYKAAEEKALG